MIRHVVTVSSGTLTSRLLGFVRDSLTAALLGAGPVADAFLVAFQFINVTRRLLAEGALNAALVPGYLRARDSGGPVAAAAFAGRVMGTMSLILIVIAVMLGLLMPQVMSFLAPGFVAGTLDSAVADARLMLPYFAFVGPVTVMMGVLNAEHRFLLSAFSPLLFNITLIGVTLLLMLRGANIAFAATAMAATVGLAGLLQTLVLIQRRRDREGLAHPVRASFDPEMRAFLRKAVPGMFANAGPQFLMVAGAILASSSPAAVSWLYFANRLIELPLGVVGVAMGTVLVPSLTRAVHDGDRPALVKTESRGVEFAVGLVLPATLGLIVLSELIVRVLFEHGAFTAEDTRATAQALMVLALGLPAHVLVKTLSPAFFARDNTAIPLWATLAGLAAAVIAGLLLGPRFGANGVAVSIALGAWCCAGVLLWRGAGAFGLSLDDAARRRLPRIVGAAVIMGAVLWLAEAFVAPVTAEAHFTAQLTILGGLVAVGLALYGLLLELLGIVSWSQAIDDLRA
ncbi:murein biosynthesis integral membrane protein MurJ [Bradyrhizobium sp. U87765 SZCCT0131]|uniref:murein biosynthesis integral membrane protein MurJ n=1 Tax=unclassified Bradyrhizobium TaxID=2631580 RepID=UPI001BA4B5E3|nr:MULTISPECIES: murein biosynthesis integral membrane protein MurJ [unclassified Bradyrhizobium]MBR1216658.1 murein biosynthesis integral membrane protein MurJ [Bradyrhizobium sp. U87765 SZCCT0131]MBR1259586.1 murein biosynthesis integral membrane protein MurJ [Bradyrhizobium sp. U87765 SZCCT0134]MBR1305727.1 murein biosynthesis integral membrane protein MurJ [Bradyrhizobium sp. U87765 SZCCT0110]MBR1322094.1 murein biosynthesis integral membrane protein MurJ [Bradyrhizobium sp. U87765 SZCCT010